MDTARIAALLAPFLEETLPEENLQQISTYIDLILRWNRRINLTAIRDAEQIVTRHFGESLFMARHLFPIGAPDDALLRHAASGAAVQVLDIGSGAGFPGLPLKIWAPAISLTLVESSHKKAAFLREAARALRLTDVNVTTARAETLSGPADVVTLRAVERFDTILPVAARLVIPAGRLALLIGSNQLPSLTDLGPLFHPAASVSVPQSLSRVLSIVVRR